MWVIRAHRASTIAIFKRVEMKDLPEIWTRSSVSRTIGELMS